MDRFTQEDVLAQTERELTSTLCPKRPRTHYTMTNNNDNDNEKSSFGFPGLLTFQSTVGSPSPASTCVRNLNLVCTACRDIEDSEQPQDTELIVMPASKLSTLQTGPTKASLIAAESPFTPLEKDELSPVSEPDKLSSYSPDDAGGALPESHTSNDASADTSGQPDCRRPGKSLDDEPPGGYNLAAENDKDGRQVLNSVTQIQAFALSSSDEEVRCQSDCTHDDKLPNPSFCNTWSQSAEMYESNQKRDKRGFSENLLFSKEKEERSHLISSNDYADSELFPSNSEEDPSGNEAEGVKNEEKILELQIGGKETVVVCKGETKGRVNENDLSENTDPSAVECAEGSIVSCDVALVRNIATENASLEADDFCGARAERAAGKMIAGAQSKMADHTTETPMLGRISQESAEGDNDAGRLRVIDPAIWSETDRDAEGKRRDSASAAGVALSPSVKIGEMEMPRPACSDVRPSQEASAAHQTWQLNHQRSRAQRPEDEKEASCQSHAEPQACFIAANETHSKAGDESSCRRISGPSGRPQRPAKPPPAVDGGREPHRTVKHLLKEQDSESSCFPVKTQEVEYLQTQMVRGKEATETASLAGETSTDENRMSGLGVDFVGRLLQQNEKLTGDTSALLSIGCPAEGKKSQSEATLTHRGEKMGSNMECLSDHPYSAAAANIFMAENAEDGLLAFAFPDTSDAVVPGPHELTHSQNAGDSPAVLNCSDRFSPVPSASTSCDRVPGGFDTFEKIQLSLDDEDDGDDGRLCSSLLVTSLASQLSRTSQRRVHHLTPEAKRNEHQEEPEEREEVGGFGCHTENTENGFLSSDYVRNELANFIWAADVAALEQQPTGESACDSSECFQDESKPRSPSSAVSSQSDGPASDTTVRPEFEMKRQFDTVLKELNLYFEISVSDFLNDGGASSPERGSDGTEALKDDTSNYKKHPRSSEEGRHGDTSSDDAVCAGDPVVSCTSGGGEGEQEVPLGGRLYQEVSTYAAETHCEPREMEKKKKTWSPSFSCRPLLEPLSQSPAEQPRRLEPLRTCTRPIRVGLSKRAKTKHLHRPHPYR